MHQRIKIVATIGPNTANSKKLKQMFSAGMSLARLNGSHNTLEWHKDTIKLIKRVSQLPYSARYSKNKNCQIET